MTNTESGNRFRGRGFIAAAIVVGIIVLAAIVVLVTSLTRGDSTPEAVPTNTPTSTATPTTDAADESVCGLEGFDTENTVTEAPETEWELVGTVAAPTDPAIGPGTVDSDGFRTCFSHTAEGALFAAVNFVATGTDATIGPRLIELVAPGPGRDVLESNSNSSGSPSSLRAQVAGYTVSSYTADGATIDLALNYSSGDLVSFPLKLVWAEGDWKLQMTDEGELPLSPSAIANLGGYTPWSGT
jgi:hypothetical protein